MPHLDIFGLSEMFCLTNAGNHHWSLISKFTSKTPTEWKNDQGKRIYASFLYTSISYSRNFNVKEDDIRRKREGIYKSYDLNLGKKIKVYGKILDNKCKPISNAVIDIWQANSFGKYNHKADLSDSRKDNNFYGYIRLLSNKNGEYSFNTILPGSYKVSKDLIRTPHIHFKVTNNQKQLTTQMYFKENEMNNKDFLFNI